jgi:hypothetical protein
MTLVAFTLAALVTFALVLAGLSAASALSQERRTDARDDSRDAPAPAPGLPANALLPPWVVVGADTTSHADEPAERPAPERNPRAHH